jgi:uncharacterized Ntn-hydrolase superfamily protein
MTFSIAAFCMNSGQFGVAAATKMNAVGKLACHAKAGVGAVATQAEVNPYLGYDGLRLLEKGMGAEEVLDTLISQDPDPHARQVGVVDHKGRVAAWNGRGIFDWSGDRQGRFFVTQGNRLVGPQVLEAIVKSLEQTQNRVLAERLLLGLEAGVGAGGDSMGENSGNIVVYDTEEYPLWDIRVDDHEKPIQELRRLFHLFEEKLLPEILKLPKRTEFPKRGR